MTNLFMKRGATAIAAGSLLVSLSACGATGDEGGGDGPIKIGAVLSLSGPAAPFGVPERDAAEAFIADVNDDGGVEGRELELIVLDDKTDPTEAASQAQTLVDEEVVAIIGSSTGSATQAMGAVTSPAEIPVIGQNVTIGITGDYVFLATVGDEDILPAIYERMRSTGAERIGVFYQEDALGQYGSDLFEELAGEDDNAEIVATANAPLDATDLSAQATKIRNGDPDAVFMAVSSTGLGASFMRASRQAGLDVDIYGGISLAQDTLIEAADGAAEGLVVSNIVDPSDLLPSQESLYDLLRDRGTEPVGGFPDITGAASASMIVEGLREAGADATGSELVEAWETEMEMETFTSEPGQYGPDDRHAHTADVIQWTQVVDGKFVTHEAGE